MSLPDLLFEISWEVCNRQGGVHSLLASKAAAMRRLYGERYVAVGPDLPRIGSAACFREEGWNDEWPAAVDTGQVNVRLGRWLVPGEPRAMLINFAGLYARRDEILREFWDRFRLDSLLGDWDYVEPLLFGVGAGLVLARIHRGFWAPSGRKPVAHVHEWAAAGALLQLKAQAPDLGTVFTTHGTTLGRALAAAGRFRELHGQHDVEPDTLAREMNVLPRHSLERIAAGEAHVLTTVSSGVAGQCRRFLGREPDLLLPNALADDVPDPALTRPETVAETRRRLLELASRMTGASYDAEKTDLVVGGGRYEFSNKGIDVYLRALGMLRDDPPRRDGRVVALAAYPTGHSGARRSLLKGEAADGHPVVTHYLRDEPNDAILRTLQGQGLANAPADQVHVIYVPIYLDGQDPLLPVTFFHLLAAADLTVFPSMYEPWGYSPMESVACGTPTVTTDQAGFGQWALRHGEWRESGIQVLARRHYDSEQAAAELKEFFSTFFRRRDRERYKLRQTARATGRMLHWDREIDAYRRAESLALNRAEEIRRPAGEGIPAEYPGTTGSPSTAGARLQEFLVLNRMPPELERLRHLSRNVWWSWNPDAVDLFVSLDPEHWRAAEGNPRKFLETVPPDRLENAAASAAYLRRLDAVWARFESQFADKKDSVIAYFCAEYGLVNYLRLYSGGLGILAGDYLKTASDLRFPLCAVGLAYRFGYFRQRINSEAMQEAVQERNEFISEPMEPVCGPGGEPLTVTVPFPTGPVQVRAWRVGVGMVDLYLLDTDFEGNRMAERSITNSLYGGDLTHRLHQELVLGVGGYHMLRALGIRPRIYHMNEGHSAFLILARLARLIQDKGLQYHEALEYVRHTSVFTTHTPVAAGHDTFPEEMIRPYLAPYAEAIQKDWPYLYALGRSPEADGADGGQAASRFSMTKLAFHGSIRTNGVSAIHGAVTRRMFKELFPGFHEEEVPVTHVTNGVHVHTWVAPEWQRQFDAHLGPEWRARLTDEGFWDRVRAIPDDVYWETHQSVKGRLIAWLRRHVATVWAARREQPAAITDALANLREDAFVICFARRFATYKRAHLILQDLSRLERMLNEHPVLLLFAGKAHPADEPGKQLIRRVIEVSRMPQFRGKVLFVENYAIDVAHLLTAGSDVWLNNPTPPLEASGTSGMKAAMNGCLNVSVADGWWAEAWNGRNGWSIDAAAGSVTPEFLDAYDSARIYSIFEREVLPLFFARDHAGIPHGWIERMKESMATIIPGFTTERMAREYLSGLYEPSIQNGRTLEDQGFHRLLALNERKERIAGHWSDLRFQNVRIRGLEDGRVPLGDEVVAEAELRHPQIEPQDLQVQIVVARTTPEGALAGLHVTPMHPVGGDGEASRWEGTLRVAEPGTHTLGIRVLPSRCHEDHELEPFLNLVKWLS